MQEAPGAPAGTVCPQHAAPSHSLQTLKYLVQSGSAYAACLPVALASPGAADRCASGAACLCNAWRSRCLPTQPHCLLSRWLVLWGPSPGVILSAPSAPRCINAGVHCTGPRQLCEVTAQLGATYWICHLSAAFRLANCCRTQKRSGVTEPSSWESLRRMSACRSHFALSVQDSNELYEASMQGLFRLRGQQITAAPHTVDMSCRNPPGSSQKVSWDLMECMTTAFHLLFPLNMCCRTQRSYLR